MQRDIDPKEIQAVIAHYGIGPLVGQPGPAGGTANANVRIGTSNGTYFLRRRNPKYSNEAFVAFDHALMEHLGRHRVATPLAVPTREGKRWLRLEKDVYEVYPYHRGGPHDRHSLAEIASAGRALAAFHRAVRDFEPPGGKNWPRYDDPRLIREGIEAVEPDLRRSLSGEDLDYLLGQISALESELPGSRYDALPKLVIHGDYHPGNLLFLKGEVSGIFDLDWATLQPRLRDLADGIFLFAGERATDIDASDIFSLTQTWKPSVERESAFMNAYLESEALSQEEAQALPLFVRARWLYCRVAGMAKVPPCRRVEYLANGVVSPLRMLDRMRRLF